MLVIIEAATVPTPTKTLNIREHMETLGVEDPWP